MRLTGVSRGLGLGLVLVLGAASGGTWAAEGAPTPPTNLKLVGDHWTPWDPPEVGPEAYIIQQGPMNRNPSDPLSRPHFQVLDAMKKGKILFVDEQAYSRPGPRAVDAVEELAIFLHPNRN